MLGVALFAIQAAKNSWDLGFGRPFAPVIIGIVLVLEYLPGHKVVGDQTQVELSARPLDPYGGGGR